MIPTYDKIHLKFKLNSNSFTKDELNEVAYSLIKEGEPFERVLGDFLLDWLDGKSFIEVKTSGSTGSSKTIYVSKQAMVNSAISTGDYFKLEPGDTALHCLPSHFIAGKMMLVRAMILGLELDLVAPSSAPVFNTNKAYTFCAMVPMQLQNSIEKINNFKTMIVGGAAVSNGIIKQLKNTNCKVYATYGMTETLSHIAIKALNGAEKQTHYNLLNNITISKDDRDCLVVEAPNLTKEIITTNDIVELHSETSFNIIGRFDNMINSGGVKVFPEQVEAKLQGKIDARFFIAGIPDDTLGEKVILVVEGLSHKITPSVFKGLQKFEIPKEIFTIETFIETPTQKLQRSKTLALLK